MNALRTAIGVVVGLPTLGLQVAYAYEVFRWMA